MQPWLLLATHTVLADPTCYNCIAAGKAAVLTVRRQMTGCGALCWQGRCCCLSSAVLSRFQSKVSIRTSSHGCPVGSPTPMSAPCQQPVYIYTETWACTGASERHDTAVDQSDRLRSVCKLVRINLTDFCEPDRLKRLLVGPC
jgi:hypothetical protein